MTNNRITPYNSLSDMQKLSRINNDKQAQNYVIISDYVLVGLSCVVY